MQIKPAAPGLPHGDTITSYALNYGDHTKTAGKAMPKLFSHSYAAPGTYTISLAFSDKHHQSRKASTTVTIQPVTPVYSADGQGNTETPTFTTLGAGWTVAYAWDCTATYLGYSNFIIDGYSGGALQEVFANELSARGSTAKSADYTGAGSYYLDIQTQCSWHVDVYPVHVSLSALPTAPSPTSSSGLGGGSATTGTVLTTAPVVTDPTVVSTTPISAPTVPAGGPTALCKDGTYSYSQTRSGTCSHHGGVASWL